MSSTYFAPDDGDIILRPSSGPDSNHDFCVHRIILSLASPVFKDMFTFPQPPNQPLNARHELPVVEVPESPKVLDAILRFIYPGAEPPDITETSTLSALLSAADKYNIASIIPTLREKLRASLTPYYKHRHLCVYITACRFGFRDVAWEAVKGLSAESLSTLDDHGDLQYISSAELFRLFQFVQKREREGLLKIRDALCDPILSPSPGCPHTEDAADYYFHLQKAVEGAFIRNPCVEFTDLLLLLDKVPDSPPGCDPPPRPAEWYGDVDDNIFQCPLQPMTIRTKLSDLGTGLFRGHMDMLREFFKKNFGDG